MHVAVIGAGKAGREFASSCALSGLTVTLEDVMPERLRNAWAFFATLSAQVGLVSSVEDAVEHADVVFDFVPDELESKLEIFSLLDRMAPPRTVLCTPSQSLSITDLASCTYRSDRCIMVRDYTPEQQRVRLLLGRRTSSDTEEIVKELFSALDVAAYSERDPDLPMLMKNMGDGGLDPV